MRALIATFAMITAATIGLLAQAPTLADACAGLIGSNGAVNLGRTTTLAAYHDGVEHYITAFEFQGRSHRPTARSPASAIQVHGDTEGPCAQTASKE